MTGLPVSVIIPNRDRTRSLARTLAALKRQSLRGFEVVIVSNRAEEITRAIPQARDAIIVPFEPANISRARNAGCAAASGEILAFCDDDAVPEPTWLARLIAPFSRAQVGATGGLVRGRNGVSLQWGFQEVDAFGNDWPLPRPDAPFTGAPTPGRVLKKIGRASCRERV